MSVEAWPCPKFFTPDPSPYSQAWEDRKANDPKLAAFLKPRHRGAVRPLIGIEEVQRLKYQKPQHD